MCEDFWIACLSASVLISVLIFATDSLSNRCKSVKSVDKKCTCRALSALTRMGPYQTQAMPLAWFALGCSVADFQSWDCDDESRRPSYRGIPDIP